MDNVNVLSKDLRIVVRKEIPFIPGAWVDFYDDVTIGAIKKAQSAKEEGSLDASLDVILAQIADWNFAGKDGKNLPIEKESLELLPTKLLKWIADTGTEIINTEGFDSKKKASQEN